LFVLIATLALLVPHPTFGQVLGACGTASENEPVMVREAEALTVMPVPLPGQHAINFELPAVLGDDIKKIKLSDYNNQWRVVCFYPADFTFV
jgi:peroxiredoxin (alkyl hydroperoxide reductase subunit C)